MKNWKPATKPFVWANPVRIERLKSDRDLLLKALEQAADEICNLLCGEDDHCDTCIPYQEAIAKVKS